MKIYKKYLAVTMLLLINTTSVLAIENDIAPCDPSGKSLYRDIQIYYESKNLKNENGVIIFDEALIGTRLQQELDSTKNLELFNDLSEHEKIHTIATSFAKCEMSLTEKELQEDKLIIDLAKESELKRKNPYKVELE